MDSRTQSWIDQDDARMADAVRRHGWLIQYVGGEECSKPGCDCPTSDGPPFAYTVGLFGLAHPELLIFGVPPEIAAGVLNDLGERVRKGEALLPGQLITFDEWPHSIIPEPVPNPGDSCSRRTASTADPTSFRFPSCNSAMTTRKAGSHGMTPTPHPRCNPDREPSQPGPSSCLSIVRP